MVTAAMCLALVIYTEAGTENDVGRAAVGWAVINSAKAHHVKRSICIETFGGAYVGINKYHSNDLPHGKLWKKSVATAQGILHGRIQDPTGGSTNFECTNWNACVENPSWASRMEYLGVFGTQKFWRRK